MRVFIHRLTSCLHNPDINNISCPVTHHGCCLQNLRDHLHSYTAYEVSSTCTAVRKLLRAKRRLFISLQDSFTLIMAQSAAEWDAHYGRIEGMHVWRDMLCLPCMPQDLMDEMIDKFVFRPDDVLLVSYPQSSK